MAMISTRFGRLMLAALAAPLAALAAPDDAPPLPPYPVLQYTETDLSRNINAAIGVDGGAVLLVGRMFDAAGPASWGWMIKADGTGRRIWEKELGKKAQSAYIDDASASGNGVVLAGTVNAGTGALANASAWIVSMTADGRVQWDRSLTFGQLTHAQHVAATQHGDFLVVGTVRHPVKADQTWIVRIDGAGKTTLKKTLDTPKDFATHALATLDDGTFVVAGQRIADADQEIRGWIGRFGADGKPQWSRTLEARKSRILAARAADDGSLVLAVDIGPRGPVHLMRLDGAGNVLQAPVKTGICSAPVLWRRRSGQLHLAGLGCPLQKGQPAPGLALDSAHPDRPQRFDAPTGTEFTQLVPLPESDAMVVLGVRHSGNTTTSVVMTRPLAQ